MKASLKFDGVLSIQAETDLERYALGKWMDDNCTAENVTAFNNMVFKLGSNPTKPKNNVKKGKENDRRI